MSHANIQTKAASHDNLKCEIRSLVRQQWRLAIYAIVMIIFTAAFFRAVHIHAIAVREGRQNVHRSTQ